MIAALKQGVIRPDHNGGGLTRDMKMNQQQLSALEKIIAQPKLVQSIHSDGADSVMAPFLAGKATFEADSTKPASLLQSPPKPH